MFPGSARMMVPMKMMEVVESVYYSMKQGSPEM
jgi:hypothetical protein